MRRDSLAFALSRLRARRPSFALATSDGCVITSWAVDPAEAGLLPHAIEAAPAFFPLAPGDLALIKDTSIGGPGRDRVALVMAWQPSDDLRLFLATTVAHPTLRGLALPPAPLRLGGEMHPGVLEALGPAREAILAADRELAEMRAVLEREPLRSSFTKKGLADLGAREREVLREWIADLPEGEASVDLTLPSGETLRARLISEGKHLSLDFSGTSAPKDLRLPLAATSGIVWSLLRERLGLDPAIDSFSTGFLPVTVPNGCFLNAKGACDRGLEEGTAWLRWAVESLVNKWDRRKRRGAVNPFDLYARLEFAPDRVLELRLPSGGPAVDDVEGATFWRQRGANDPALERLEQDWPVRVVRIDERVATAGKGRVNGGRGLHLQLELTAPAKFSWGPSAPVVSRLKLEKHQTPFDLPDVSLHRAGTEAALPALTPAELLIGDRLVLLSGSGGGIL